MTSAPKTRTGAPADRKDSQMNIWVGKQVGPELDELAKRESEMTGYTISRLGLAREIFLWAFELYRKTGSLSRLKNSRIVAPSTKYSEDVQRRSFESLEAIFNDAPSAVVTTVIQELAKYSSRPWERSKKK
ncbi:MAG: hypothetical protein JWO48_1212 [Bryobacterales bacterium]|nr:hypothetical protein [Bryobacterales bacterium]